MNPSDVLFALARTAKRLEDDLRENRNRRPQALKVAEILHDGWPSATLCACLFTSPGDNQLAALGADGRPDPEWLSRLAPSGVPAGTEVSSAWTTALEGTGKPAVVRPIGVEGSSHGLLALLLPDDGEAQAMARVFLDHLAPRLAAESLRREAADGAETITALERLASVGELAGPLAHEFTNFLNVLLLQVAVLEYQLPPSQRPDLAEIRRQGNLAAEAVTRFHQYRRGQFFTGREFDLNRIVADVADGLARESPAPPYSVVLSSDDPKKREGDAVALRVSLAGAATPVRGEPPDIGRLVRFLVSNAVRAAARTGNAVHVSTTAGHGRVVLRVEDSGPTPTEADLPHFFEMSHPGREGADALELSACRSLARRLGAEIRAEARPAGGAVVVVAFGPGEGG